MKRTLIDGLSEPDIQAVLDSYNLTSFLFPTLFPLSYTDELSWKSIEGTAGAPVAADVVSYDSRAPRKRRTEITGAKGEIPKISIAREKKESEIIKYHNLRKKNTKAAEIALLEWIWEDQQFVFDGVNARLEWLALKAASTGKVELTTTNNDGIVTEASIDFLIPKANKKGASVPITAANKSSAKPISDIQAIVKDAKAKGIRLRYIFTDQETVDNILIADETVNRVAPWVLQATQLTQIPTLEALNRYLSSNGLPTIYVIDSFVTLEIKGERSTVAPWQPGVMLFSETEQLGKTDHTDLADDFAESSTALKARREHVLIKRYSLEEPLVEVTLGMANAFPVLSNPKRKFLLNSLGTSWTL